MALPTFQDIRVDALRLLGDALDVLRSDWAQGHGPTDEQAKAMWAARDKIGAAKNALDRAGAAAARGTLTHRLAERDD